MFALIGLISSPYLVNVQAAQYHESMDVDEIIETTFSDLKRTELVLEMSEGGCLYGKETEYSTNDVNTVIAEYDSESDSNSVTVAEAETTVQPYVAIPPTADRCRI